MSKNEETATLAGGCFWCTEGIFKRIRGVNSVVSGYTGGKTENPTYEAVCEGSTGHAEAIQISFDPSVISYEKLLEIFFHFHDPTTMNRQGNDTGTQYRSAIFYHDEEQKKSAEKVKDEVQKSGYYKDKIVTEIASFTNFYKAEEYHQDFYNRNRESSYCQYIMDPKIRKLLSSYQDIVK